MASFGGMLICVAIPQYVVLNRPVKQGLSTSHRGHGLLDCNTSLHRKHITEEVYSPDSMQTLRLGCGVAAGILFGYDAGITGESAISLTGVCVKQLADWKYCKLYLKALSQAVCVQG